jgi:hypothetical protein
LTVYAAKVIKKDLKQSVYGSFFLMNMFFFVPLQNKNKGIMGGGSTDHFLR